MLSQFRVLRKRRIAVAASFPHGLGESVPAVGDLGTGCRGTSEFRPVLDGCPRPTIELPEEIEITTLAERPQLAQGVWETAREAMADIPADGTVR